MWKIMKNDQKSVCNFGDIFLQVLKEILKM